MRLGRTLAILLLLLPEAGRAATMRTGILEESHRIEVLVADPARTVVKFEVGSFELVPVNADGRVESRIAWDGGVDRLEQGNPALPSFRESLVIPDDGVMSVRVLSSEFRDFPGVRIAPSKGPITRDVNPATVPYEYSDVYTTNAWFPAAIADLGEPYILRDERGLVVEVNAFRWNPATGTLRVFSSVTVEVKRTGDGGANVLTSRPATRVAEFEKIYSRHFLNWNRLGRYTSVGEAGCMVVVAADVYLAAVQPLVDWKNQRGLNTTLVPLSQIGTTATQLKAYVQNCFNTDGLCYLLLVGDATQIPYFMNGGGASDPMQTLLAGTDSYPDAFVGRLSAETVAQVDTQVQRIVEYERNPDSAAIWYSKGIAIASNEGDGIGDDGEADWQHAQNYRAELLGFTYTTINELYDGNHPSGGGLGGGGSDQPGNPTATNVSSLLNSGRGLVHYTGHGSTYDWVTTGFGVSNINALTNDNMLPFVVSVGCVNGQFAGTTCFAEAWMRATHLGEPTGAIACYASTVNQQWATPMEAQDEMIALLCAEEKWTFGGTCFNGSCSMIDHYGSNGITEFKNWTIFGDPSLQMRTATPTALAATHNATLDPETGVFEVTTEPGATAAISDTFALLGSAVANVSGLAAISFDSEVVGALDQVTLTVTGFNRIPTVETIEVQAGATSAPEIARGIHVGQNEPNPFERSTDISLVLDRESAAKVEIFDVTGRKIRTLDGGVLAAGTHRLVWDGTNESGTPAAAGTYFYRLPSSKDGESRRMVLLR